MIDRVRGKFFIQTVSAYAAGNGEVIMKPATRGAENADWAAATPSGEYKMTINNPTAFDFFRDNLSQEVYIDISLVNPDLADASKHDFVLFENTNHYNNGKCLHCGQAEEFHGVKG